MTLICRPGLNQLESFHCGGRLVLARAHDLCSVERQIPQLREVVEHLHVGVDVQRHVPGIQRVFGMWNRLNEKPVRPRF